MAAPAIRVLEHNVVTFRHIWRSYLVSVITPLLFLVVFGLGIGPIIDRSGMIPGSYLAFLAPGLMVGAAMQGGALAGFGPIMGRIRWDPVYESMLYAPLRVIDVLAGEVLWIVLRLTVTCGLFLVVMVTLPGDWSGWVVLGLPVAVLTGLAFATVFMAIASVAPNGYTYDVLSRVVIIPLLMFGGIFFPSERLPVVLQRIVELTPLPHGTSLARTALASGPVTPTDLLHLVVLACYVLGGWLLAYKTFEKRLRG